MREAVEFEPGEFEPGEFERGDFGYGGFEPGEFEYGGFGAGVGSAGVGLVLADRGGRARLGQQARRPAAGPRPVRPAVAPVWARPAPVERHAVRIPSRAREPRVLARRPVAQAPVEALRFRVRRVVAGMLATVVTVAVVVGLGLLADAASAARTPAARSAITVTVGAGESLGDVARRAAPGEDVSAVVGRIVTANALTPARLRPGQVLRVPVG